MVDVNRMFMCLILFKNPYDPQSRCSTVTTDLPDFHSLLVVLDLVKQNWTAKNNQISEIERPLEAIEFKETSNRTFSKAKE